uniref:Eukaryotic translation initiation factor 4E transporter-like n=1 Tax=Callorhinchus milii TaxID=7868 RepID=A0A4W3HL64_CALMI
MLSPSFTPTSVIRKMFESKEKGKDGKENQAAKECPEDGHGLIEDHLSPVSLLENSERGTSPIGMRPSTFPRSACTTPQLNQMRFTKDHDYRPKSAGRKTPTRASPIPGSPFSRPVCPAPLVSHVPFVRSSPPHLPPVVVQRMLAQGMTPQQFHPALVHAVLQSPNATAQGPGAQVLLNQQNSTVRGLHQRSGSPVNLSKWFGSDVLQQPLPSMPSKVISVDELELHQ